MSGTLLEQRATVLRFLNSDGLSVKHWQKELREVFGFEKTKDGAFIFDPCPACGVQQALSTCTTVMSGSEAERDDFIKAVRDIADHEGLLVKLERAGTHATAIFAAPAIIQRLTGQGP